MPITPFYAALLGLIFFALSVRAVRLRRRLRIVIGDGGNAEMQRAMRVHANFAEYVPLSLLLIAMFESLGGARWLVHALCIALLAGRLVHASGVSKVREDFRLRVAGMSMTFAALGGAALSVLAMYALAVYALAPSR
jgi:uncharacterized membrane protein YecN with MAPEG domain